MLPLFATLRRGVLICAGRYAQRARRGAHTRRTESAVEPPAMMKLLMLLMPLS